MRIVSIARYAQLLLTCFLVVFGICSMVYNNFKKKKFRKEYKDFVAIVGPVAVDGSNTLSYCAIHRTLSAPEKKHSASQHTRRLFKVDCKGGVEQSCCIRGTLISKHLEERE